MYYIYTQYVRLEANRDRLWDRPYCHFFVKFAELRLWYNDILCQYPWLKSNHFTDHFAKARSRVRGVMLTKNKRQEKGHLPRRTRMNEERRTP